MKKTTWLWLLFNRYYSGKANARERHIIETWHPFSEEKSELDSESLERGCDEIWNSLSEKYLENTDIEKEKERFLAVSFRKVAMIAALFVLILFSLESLFDRTEPRMLRERLVMALSQKEYFETTDSIRKVELPDGSIVYLNCHTRLAYLPKLFNRERRDVWLEDGEAFFEVASNKEKAFVVHHGRLRTIVRGTSFNIRSYKTLGGDVISVRSGKVEVQTGSSLLGLLTRNEEIVYDRVSEEYRRGMNDASDFTAWMKHRLVLKNATVAELKLRISQLYHKDLVFEQGVLSGICLSASFNASCSLENVLDVISELYGVDYKEENDRVIFYK